MNEWKLKDGDFVPDGTGDFCRLEGSEAVLQRVLFKLTARRGSFPFLPELGSQLHRLGQELYVRQTHPVNCSTGLWMEDLALSF